MPKCFIPHYIWPSSRTLYVLGFFGALQQVHHAAERQAPVVTALVTFADLQSVHNLTLLAQQCMPSFYRLDLAVYAGLDHVGPAVYAVMTLQGWQYLR